MTTTPTPIDFAVYWSDNARLHAKVPELCRVCEGTGLMHATADEQQFMQDPTQRIHDCLFCPTIGEMLRKYEPLLALAEYAEHRPGCPAEWVGLSPPPGPCTCGLDAARAALEAVRHD